MLRNLSVLAEKTFWTFIEVFLTGFLGSGQFGFTTAQAAAIGGVSAAITVVANGLPEISIVTGNSFFDTVGRTIRTAVVSFLGYLVAAPILDLSVDGLKAAAIAAIPAALAGVKSAGSSYVGNKDTAALLPVKVDS